MFNIVQKPMNFIHFSVCLRDNFSQCRMQEVKECGRNDFRIHLYATFVGK